MYTEGFVAYRLPDDKRDVYFEWIDNLIEAAPVSYKNSNWDAISDPIVQINDITVFSEKNQKAIRNFMQRIGAQDVTSAYTG